MRASCDIVVRVDVAAAIAAGMVRASRKAGAGAEREWEWERECERERERESGGGCGAERWAGYPSCPLPPSPSPSHPRTQIFYESANGVLLSEGFDGVIPPRFFTGAEERKTGESLDLAELAPLLEADGDVPAADGVGGGGGTSAG